MSLVEKFLKKSGVKPKDEDHNVEQVLFSFAAIFGVKKGQIVHRKALFNFVQIFWNNYSESIMQSEISNSNNWQRTAKGFYQLTEYGEYNVNWEFQVSSLKSSVFPIVKFSLDYNGSNFAVVSYPNKKPSEVYINSRKVTSIYVYDILLSKGVELRTEDVSRPREILNWILQNEYQWEILNYDEIVGL